MNQTSASNGNGNGNGQGLAATYFLAQHTPDPFRREPRNIGVIVCKGDMAHAKFVGERDDGEFDGRIVRHVAKSQKAYRMWVRHWKKKLNSGGLDACQSLVTDGSSQSFNVLSCGEVLRTGHDSVVDICSYLYALLVGEGGLREALGATDSDATVAELRSAIHDDLKQLKILKSLADQNVNHPVYEDREVRGARHWHIATFCQELAHRKYVSEPVNFTTTRKNQAKERAGYASLIFNDLRAAGVETTVVYRATSDDLNSDVVQYSMSLLRDNSDEMVNWHDPKERRKFTEKCRDLALAA